MHRQVWGGRRLTALVAWKSRWAIMPALSSVAKHTGGYQGWQGAEVH